MANPEQLYPDGPISPFDLYVLASAEAHLWSRKVQAGGYLRFPWPGVDRMVGPLVSGFLVLVGARGKGGKSTFMREVFGQWVEEGKRVLYVGTEQSAAILRLLWAAVRLGVDQAAAIDPRHPRHADCLADVALAQGDLADRAIIVADADLSIDGFVRWARVAYREKCDVLMLDHFHRLEATDGNRRQHEVRGATVRRIKNVAVKGDMVIVAAAQLNNGPGGDLLGQHEVPGPGSWAETSSLRRECDVAIQLWRPFKPKVLLRKADGSTEWSPVTKQMKLAAQDDPAKIERIVEANVMAVRCDAHRYLDVPPHAATRLHVHGGQVSSWTGAVPAGPPPEQGDAYDGED